MSEPGRGEAPSELVAGHIRILGTLGVGGMGEVYVGFDERLRRRVALKTIRTRRRLDPDFKARFLREARILSRLDHPNICRIHDYVEGEDRDFLVLEMVEGATLERALEEGIDEGRKLPVAEQMAEALAAAHAQGVVHRDLKPGNVMLTPGGGVKILDFGIARPARSTMAHRPEPGEPPEPRPVSVEDETVLFQPANEAGGGALAAGADGGTGTLVGSLVGTPAYMSPEQASRQPATTASDMYAFGLVLQELFTGLRAFPPELDAEALLEWRRRGETLPVEGTDRDLAALVRDLLAPAPAERPTAAETVRRLRWIRDKPRRRTIRWAAIAAVVILVLGGFKYTFDLKAARDDADRRRAQAEDLIGFMLGDLRGKLSGVGRLDLLEDVGDKALDYFESLPDEDRTPEELFRRSEALRQIGEVRIGQGDLEAADDAFVQSLRISEDLVAREPERSDWLLGLAHAHFWIGNVEWLRGDLDAALERFEEYRRIAERLTAAEPDETEWRLEMAYAYTNLAAVHDARGDDEPALAALRRSIDLKEDLVARNPSNTEWRTSLANGLSWLGSQLEERGDLAGALESFETERRMRRALLEAEPRSAEGRVLLADSLAHGGRLRLLVGEIGAARDALEEARKLYQALVAHDPANQDWRRTLGVVHRILGETGLAAGDAEGANAEAEAATTIFDELTEHEPSNRDWQDELIHAHLLTAEAALARDRPAEALAATDRVAPLLAPRLEAQPDHRTLRHMRGRELLARGRARAAQDRPEEARAALEAAHDEIAGIAEGSRDIDLLDTWARLLLRTGRRTEAEAVVESLLATGYRRPDFLACCVRERDLPSPVDRERSTSRAASAIP